MGQKNGLGVELVQNRFKILIWPGDRLKREREIVHQIFKFVLCLSSFSICCVADLSVRQRLRVREYEEQKAKEVI